MAEQEIKKSSSVVSPEKSGSVVLLKSLKAVPSISKSSTSLNQRKSESSNNESVSLSTQSIEKSNNVVESNKSLSKDSLSMRKTESKFSQQEPNSENLKEDKERSRVISTDDLTTGKHSKSRKRVTKFMRKYPELFRDDVSIHPSYTGLKKLPYHVVCRQRFHKNKLKINRALNKEIDNITMMQTLALDGVRVERIFSVGFHPSHMILQDFATPSERLRLNRMLEEKQPPGMFRSAHQNGFLSILYSCGSSPLAIWDKQVKNGYIKRVTDDEVKSLVLEIAGTNVATTFISCPQDPKKILGIKLPFLIMIIKNMKKYFTFEITILDDKDMRRRFRASNFQSTTRVRPFCTTMPIGLSGGWNQLQFNLADFTRRAYGSNYIETTRIQIHANCRIRRIYYADRLYPEEDIPQDYKLFLPIHHRRPTRENKMRRSTTKNTKVAEGNGEGLPIEPPPFASSAPEEEESKGFESVSKENPGEELLVSEFSQNRISDRRSSNRMESKQKSTAVTIKEKSQDEVISSYNNEADINTGEETDEDQENVEINLQEELVDDEFSQPVIQTEEMSEIVTNSVQEDG